MASSACKCSLACNCGAKRTSIYRTPSAIASCPSSYAIRSILAASCITASVYSNPFKYSTKDAYLFLNTRLRNPLCVYAGSLTPCTLASSISVDNLNEPSKCTCKSALGTRRRNSTGMCNFILFFLCLLSLRRIFYDIPFLSNRITQFIRFFPIFCLARGGPFVKQFPHTRGQFLGGCRRNCC